MTWGMPRRIEFSWWTGGINLHSCGNEDQDIYSGQCELGNG